MSKTFFNATHTCIGTILDSSNGDVSHFERFFSQNVLLLTIVEITHHKLIPQSISSSRKIIKFTHGDSQYIKELSLATVDLGIKIEVPSIKSVHLRDLNTPEVL